MSFNAKSKRSGMSKCLMCNKECTETKKLGIIQVCLECYEKEKAKPEAEGILNLCIIMAASKIRVKVFIELYRLPIQHRQSVWNELVSHGMPTEDEIGFSFNV